MTEPRGVVSRRVLNAASVAGLLTAGACSEATTSTIQPPLAVFGCHQLAIGKWSAPRESPDPPGVVVLLDSIGSYLLENGKLLVRPHPVGTPMPFDMAWWDRPFEEQLDLMFTDGGYVGVRLHFTWSGARWQGSAWAFTDVPPTLQAAASTTLVPRLCP